MGNKEITISPSDDKNAYEVPPLSGKIISDYEKEKDDEISVKVGDEVRILEKNTKSRWKIQYKGRTGFIPSVHIEEEDFL